MIFKRLCRPLPVPGRKLCNVPLALRMAPWLLLLAAVFATGPARAAENVLDEINILPDPKGNAVRMNLTFPMRVLSYQPQRHGDLIQVQVQPIALPGVDLCALTERQTLLWSASDAVPLIEVTYQPVILQIIDRNGENPCAFGETIDPNSVAAATLRIIGSGEISLRFNRKVWFEVEPSSDPRMLGVVLLGATEGEVDVKTTQEVEGETLKPLVPDPADEPLNVPRTPAGAGPRRDDHGARPLPAAEQRYIVSLLSSPDPFVTGGIPQSGIYGDLTQFSSATFAEGVPRYRLNIGFFSDLQSAEAFREQVRIQFPEAAVHAATDRDREAALEAPLKATTTTAPPSAAELMDSRPGPADRMAELVDEAREDLIAKEFSTAIRKLEAVAADNATPYRREAQELLGLAHERALQYELAVVDYNTYLAWFPEGPDSERVRQRLAGLLTISQEQREALRLSRAEKIAAARAAAKPAAAPAEVPVSYDLLGGLSQNWRRQNQKFSGESNMPVTSLLQSNVDLNGRMRSERYAGRARVNAGYSRDLLSNSSFEPQTQVSNLFFEGGTRDKTRLARVGRQSGGAGGVLGRFDGGVVSYALNPTVKLNVVGGLLVESSSNNPPSTDKYFYGANFDIGQLWEAWDFKAFFIEQRAFDILDRRAIGGEARYFKDNVSVFSLADYDVSYTELNTLLVLGNYFFANRASVSASVDYRKSPYVATSAAVQGQTVSDLEELDRILPRSTIRDLAEDRAARSTTITATSYYPFNDTFSLNFDFTASKVSSTPDSEIVPPVAGAQDVLGTPSTPWDFVYSSQLLVSNLPRDGDTLTLGAQFADLNSANTVSAYLGTRNALTPQLRIAPNIRFSHSMKIDGTDDWSLRPNVQLDYRWRRNAQFQFEAGVGHTLLGQRNAGNIHFDEYYVNAGYRLNY